MLPFDREHYLVALEENTKAFAQSILESPRTQPAGVVWNIAQIAEHVMMVEKQVLMLLPQVKEHSDAAKNYGSEKLQRILIDMRARKVVAPPSVVPSDTNLKSEEVKALWHQHRQWCTAQISSDNTVVDSRTYEHPFLGTMTIADWMYFLLHHAERHRLQMLSEVSEV